MYVDNELVEFVPTGEQEYEEEILVQAGAPETSVANFVDTPPAQGKPRCITLILNNNWIYICVVHLRYRHFMETTCIDIVTYESYQYRSSSCYTQDFGSVGNLQLLTIGDYYYYSHDKMMKGNGDRAGIWYGYWWV